MRGEVLHYDDEQGFGFINGADGKRYAFERSDLRRLIPISKGTQVEFQADAANAREIFVVRGAVASAAAASQFGREAVVAAPEDTGLWSYFIRTLTTNYANFRGRARRKEYWGFFLFWMISFLVIVGVAAYLDVQAGNFDFDYGGDAPYLTIAAVVIIVLFGFIPTLALTVRRQHDIGLSGWFYLLILVPYIGGMIIFVFTLIPSQKHDNKWGPVPYGVSI